MFLENRKLIYAIASTVVLLLVVITVIYSLIKNGVFADTANNYYDQITMNNDINDDGKDEQININVTKTGEKFGFALEVAKSGNSLFGYDLSGFESNISFCSNPVLNIGGVKTICIQGFVGAHSQNIQLMKYVRNSSNNLVPLQFNQDGRLLDNIITDAPNFSFVKEAGVVNGIYLDNRDYAKNPLVDIIRSHYYLSDSVFVFKNSEELKMAEPVTSPGSGRIN